MRNKPSIAIPDEARAKAVASLRRHVSENLDAEIGDLKAGLLLDYVVAEIGPTIYNKAIADARGFIEDRAADLDAACHPEFPYRAATGR